MATKKITVLHALKAVHKNAYKKVQGSYGSKSGACALGQGALNLGLKSNGGLHGPLNQIKNAKGETLADRIVHLNDSTDTPVHDIAHIVEKEFADQLNKVIEVEV